MAVHHKVFIKCNQMFPGILSFLEYLFENSDGQIFIKVNGYNSIVKFEFLVTTNHNNYHRLYYLYQLL